MRKILSKPNDWRNSSYRFRLHDRARLAIQSNQSFTVLSVLVYYSRRIKVLASACIEFHTVRKNIELSGFRPPPLPPPLGDYDRVRYFSDSFGTSSVTQQSTFTVFQYFVHYVTKTGLVALLLNRSLQQTTIKTMVVQQSNLWSNVEPKL